MRILLTLLVLATGVVANAARADPADRCAKIGIDDNVRPYDRRLRPEFVRAYKRLFPDSRGVPSDRTLEAQASFRCMDGRLLACFVGANLPCAKMATARDNPGASAFCRGSPNADIVPLAATGHDAAYTYRCRDGRAEVTGTTFDLDARGFAAALWTPLD